MVELGTNAAVGAYHAGGEQSHVESQCTQQRGKGSIELVAKTAAALVDDLVKKAGLVANDGTANVDVEVLEGNGEHVRTMKRAESFRRRLSIARVADAIEIGAQVQHVSSPQTERITTRPGP